MIGRRLALSSMAISALLAIAKIAVGMLSHSSSVVSDGFESASDVFASAIVLLGLVIAARPADDDHPYGHGRFETMAALAVGMMLGATGAVICVRAILFLKDDHLIAAYAIWPLIVSTFVKGGLSITKFRIGRRIGSEALIADGWNDTVDILSGLVALTAVSISLAVPGQFQAADHYGAFAVGLIVIFLGLRVMFETTMQLVDTMPPPDRMAEIRRAAATVPGALAVEKCFARRTGLRYHVDLHLEVNPALTVLESHFIAHQVRDRVREQLDWVADVLIHVEPSRTATIKTESEWKTAK